MREATAFVVAVAVTLCATPLAIAVARRAGVVDRPGALKPQGRPVPYLGGLAVLLGMVAGAAMGRPQALVPMCGAVALGVADDVAELPVAVRLAGEVAIGLTVVWAYPLHVPGAVGLPLAVVVTVVLVNGVNLLDGLDLLATGVALVAGLAFAVLLTGAGRLLALGLVGAVAAFGLFNRPPARIYLGDGGSYLIGTTLALLLAAAWAPGVPASRGLCALALVAVPVAEVALAVVRRGRGRTPLLAGDRGHPYDRLVGRGWPVAAASLSYAATAVVASALALASAHAGSVGVAVAVDLVVGAGLVALGGIAGGLQPATSSH